jgi:catechol 2,3-dioxygenase-like lactoylglutathione lyase family enzyme
MAIQILRTAYVVSDIERSLRFYRDLLGLQIMRDRIRSGQSYEGFLEMPGVEIRVVLLHDKPDGALIELVQYLKPISGRVPRKHWDIGAANTCFVVNDLAGLMQRIRAAGLKCPAESTDFVQEGKSVGRIVMVRDPDDIPVALFQPA